MGAIIVAHVMVTDHQGKVVAHKRVRAKGDLSQFPYEVSRCQQELEDKFADRNKYTVQVGVGESLTALLRSFPAITAAEEEESGVSAAKSLDGP